MNNTRSLKFIFPALFMSICCNLMSQADSSDLTNMSLEDLLDVRVTTASKISEEAKKAPAQIIVITEEQIRVRGYRSLLDVLTDLPDFKVDNGLYGLIYNSLTVRGIQGQEKFIIMLDGMRISGPANETMPIMENYPVNLAKQIEVVYGPASALYGADAVSGVINIITKKTELKNVKVEAVAQAGDNNLYNGTLFASTKLGQETVLTLSSQYFYDQGVNMPEVFGKEDSLWNMDSHKTGTFNTAFGPMTPSKKVNPNYEAPLMAYNIYAGLAIGDFRLRVFRNYSRNSSALGNNPNNAVFNKDVFYGRSINSFEAQYSKTVNKLTSVTGITTSDYRVDPYSNYQDLYNNMEGGYKYAYSTKLKIEQQLEWRVNHKFNLVGGALFENFFVIPEGMDLQDPVQDSKVLKGTIAGSTSYYRPEGLDAPFFEVHYHNFGAYAQAQYTPNDKLAFTLGSRYDHNTRYGPTINPRVGMVASLSKSTTFKLIGGTAYLPPTPVTYAYYGSFTTPDSGKTYHADFMHLPNSDLKPMHVYNAEFSLQQRFLKRFQLQLTGYSTRYTNITDLVTNTKKANQYNGQFMGYNVDNIEIFENANKQQNMGGSLRFEYSQPLRKGRWDVYATMSYVDGMIEVTNTDDEGKDYRETKEIDFISPVMFKGGTDLILGNFSFSARCVVAGKQRLFINDEITNERQTLDGYTLVNASVGYKLGKISFFMNVNNVLNVHYRNVGFGMDLSDSNTGYFHGNLQDPRRFNGGIRILL